MWLIDDQTCRENCHGQSTIIVKKAKNRTEKRPDYAKNKTRKKKIELDKKKKKGKIC